MGAGKLLKGKEATSQVLGGEQFTGRRSSADLPVLTERTAKVAGGEEKSRSPTFLTNRWFFAKVPISSSEASAKGEPAKAEFSLSSMGTTFSRTEPTGRRHG